MNVKKLIVLFGFMFLPAYLMADVLVCKQSGSINSADTWYVGQYYELPTNYTGNGSIVVDSYYTRYTSYFTPTSTDACVGVVLFLRYDSAGSSQTITATLMDGATPVRSASAYYGAYYNDNKAGCTGPFWFDFSSAPYTLSATASNWRFFLAGANSNDANFRTGATGNAGYICVTTTTKVPASGDTLVICGSGWEAGTVSSYTVTVDATPQNLGTLASANAESVLLGHNGQLTWGSSQAGSYDLPCNNNIRIFSSRKGVNGLEFGSPLVPLTSDYVQTIIFYSGATQKGVIIGDEDSSAIANNITPPTFSIGGNPYYNMGGNLSNYRAILTTPVTTSTNVAYVDKDMGLIVGTTILFTGSGALGQMESKDVTAYDSATKMITFSSNFAYAHSTGSPTTYQTHVFNMSSNARIRENDGSHTLTIKSSGYTYAVENNPIVQISNLEAADLSDLMVFGLSTTSYFNYVRISSSNLANRTAFYPHNASATECVWQSYLSASNAIATGNTYAGNCTITSTTYVSKKGMYYNVTGTGWTWDDCIFDGICFRVISSATGKWHRSKIYSSLSSSGNSGIVFNGTAARDWYFEDISIGTPVASGSQDIAVVSAPVNFEATFVSPRLYSTTDFDTDDIDDCYAGSSFKVQDMNNTGINDHRIYKPEGLIQTAGPSLTDTTTKTTGHICLKMSPYTPTYSVNTLSHSQTVSVPANSTVYVGGYYRKNSSYGTTALPRITLTSAGGAINTCAEMSATTGADTWEQFTLSGVVGAADTFITITPEAPTNVSGAACYFADVLLFIGNSITGTAQGSMLYEIWKNGESDLKPLGGSSDATYIRNSVWATYGTDDSAISTILDVIPSTTSIAEAIPAASTTAFVAAMASAPVGSVTGAVGSVTGDVTVGTNNDKTGYSLTDEQVTLISTTTASIVPSTTTIAAAIPAISTSAVAGAVWDAATILHRSTGTFGKDMLDIKNELRRR